MRTLLKTPRSETAGVVGADEEARRRRRRRDRARSSSVRVNGSPYCATDMMNVLPVRSSCTTSGAETIDGSWNVGPPLALRYCRDVRPFPWTAASA